MARVAITGGCGFLGAALARHLVENGVTLPDGRRLFLSEVCLLDRAGTAPPQDARLTFHPVDIADRSALAAALPEDVAAVWHLAAVVSGQAEAEFDLGMRVNLDGARNLLEIIRDRGRPIPVISTSSIAVYGGRPPEPLTEATAVQPQSSYGVAKAMAELLFADFRRRGWADARVLRMPTVTVRPGRPNAAASSFASGIIREPLKGEDSVCPVDPDQGMWVTSPAAAVAALAHAASVPSEDWPLFGAVNVPGHRVTVAQMLAALERHAGPEVRARVRMEPDPKIAAMVATWPERFSTPLAESLGFRADPDGIDAILRQAMGKA